MGKGCFGRSCGQHSAVNQDHPIAKLRHAAQVMGGDQDQVAFIAQRTQQVDNGVLGFDVDTGKGFVQQQDRALLCQCSRQKDAFFLASGKLTNLARAQFAQTHALQRLIDPQSVFL